ncbi:HtaA domain-containing protein [Paenarthrobacter ureafaciens]|uniref:HtaA domain-containing protein n=1 Tax=Paenarthrobacter ureafaciens TaxID=37931 RepID=UPI001AC50D36|nr:HtaA domain-containing protein [Paenarthrobacter ureafaciens]MBN9128829.1 HtaA domain-containing protein [Paenarthrobacter ureafaciens]UOD81758.1 HtaA domain-containing protein [Paenarthrobacter ureafaciens]WNZ05249.1 HtaA domain-containing protein [Paenarthrobacter ureafaciens]
MSSQEPAAPQGPPPGLTWGIKQSFMRYLGALEDTQVGLDGGASMLDVGAFNFPLAVDSLDSAGSYAFRGTVQLTAHGGMLAVTLRDPQLDIQEDTATLSVDGGTGNPMVLCTLEGGSYEALGEDLVWSADHVYLAESGVPTFGGQYQPGQALDPVLLRIPLS